MKSLLIALLLAIFSIQASFVAVSEHVPVATSAHAHSHAHSQAGLATGIDAELDADLLQSSTAIEALSDYLPAALSFARASFTAPTSRQSTLVLLSIDLPRITPPPRA